MVGEKKTKGIVRMVSSDIGPTKEGGRIGRILMEFGTITLLDEISSKKLTEKEILIILK